MKRTPGKILGLALRHLFKQPDTIAYPAGELDIDARYRGRICYDSTNCIGCNLCVRDCPANAIAIRNVGDRENKKFVCEIDLGHCIFCAQCVDSCRKGCLRTTPDIELAVLRKSDLKVHMP